MKSKSFFGLVAVLALTVLSLGTAYGQSGINWFDSPNGVALSNNQPGDSTTVTLQFIVGSGSELTNGQYLQVDLSSFQINTTEAVKEENYSFSNVYASTMNMDNDGSDFQISETITNGLVRFTLNNEFALLPADSVRLVINNKVLRNKGFISGDAVTVGVQSSDQPVLSQEVESDALAASQDQKLKTITLADSNASALTYLTIVDTAKGQIPADGQVVVQLPGANSGQAGFAVSSSIDTSKVILTAGVTKVILSSVSVTNDSVVTFTLNHSAAIAAGTQLTIQIGKSTAKIVTNPAIYAPATNALFVNNRKTYNDGTGAFGFKVKGLDNRATRGTIFENKTTLSTAGTYVVSNIFAADTGDGGVKLSDNTAGNTTNLTLKFTLGSRLEVLDNKLLTAPDTLVVDLTGFAFRAGVIPTDRSKYAFSGGGNVSDSNYFNLTNNSGIISIALDTVVVGSDTTKAFLPSATELTLTITGLLQNGGQDADADVRLRSNKQTAWVTDRDETEIFPNAGGAITQIVITDSNASMRASIDTLTFITNGEIPANGKIKIYMPANFTVNSSVDSAKLFESNPLTGVLTQLASVSAGVTNVNKITLATENNEALILTLSLSSVIADDETLKVVVGDSTGKFSGHTNWYAFTNPSPANAGTYPSLAQPGVIRVETLNSSNERLFIADNSTTRPVEVVTNAFSDSQFTFINWQGSAFNNVAGLFPVGRDTTVAGDSVGIAITFSPGSYLALRDTTGAGDVNVPYDIVNSYVRMDTLYVDLSAFHINFAEIDSGNVSFIGDGPFRVADAVNPTQKDWDSLVVLVDYDGDGDKDENIIAIVPQPGDTLSPDSTVVLEIRAQGRYIGDGPGGMLYNKGAGEKSVRLWSSRQNTSAGILTSDTTRTVRALNQYAYTGIGRIEEIDSVAANISRDTLLVKLQSKLAGGSRLSLKLPGGFSFTSGINATTVAVYTENEANVTNSVLDGFASQITHTPSSVTRQSADSLDIVFAATDSLLRESSAGRAALDSLWLVIGGAGANPTEGITNAPSDSVTNRARNFGRLAVRLYDSSGKLVQSNADSIKADGSLGFLPQMGGFTFLDSITVVANKFSGHVALNQLGGTANLADTAGAVIDTLLIPFNVGAPLVGASASLTLSFTGAVIDTTTFPATLDKYRFIFAGDTGGVGANGQQSFTVSAANDTSLTITLAAGDTIGGADPGGVATSSDVQWSDTLMIVGYIQALGAAVTPGGNGLDSLRADHLDVGLLTATTALFTTDEIKDTTNTTYVVGGAAPTVTIAGAASGAAGSDATLTLTWNNTFHGYLPKNGIIELVLPTKESNASHRHEWTVDGGVLSGTPASAVSITTKDNQTAFTFLSTGSLSNAAYGTSSDSTKITIDLSASANTIAASADSDLVISITDGLTNPKKATVPSPASVESRASKFIAAGHTFPTSYGMTVYLKDKKGNLINRSAGSTTIYPDTVTSRQLLVVSQGQYYEPGSADSVKTGTVRKDTVNNGVDFMVVAADAYGNRAISANSHNANLLPVTYTVPTASSTNYWVAADSNGAAGQDTLSQGLAVRHVSTLNGQQPFKFLVAKDGNATIGRGKHVVAASASLWGAGATGSSDSIAVEPQPTVARFLVVLPGETAAPGDTASDGKSVLGGDGDVDLVASGVYTVSTYAVDSFYNVIATRSAVPYPSGITSTDAGAAISNVTSLNTSGDSVATSATTGLFQFTLKPSAAATNKTVTVTSGSVTGAATFDIVGGGFAAAFGSVADSSNIQGSSVSYQFKAYFNGTYGSGNGWSIWAHSDSTKTYMNADDHGGFLVASSLQIGENQTALVTRDTTANVTTLKPHRTVYYLFATLPSLPGGQADTVYARSEGFYLMHQPVLNLTQIPLTPTADTTLNSSTGNETFAVKFQARDYDQSNTEIKVFLSPSNILTDNDIVVGGAEPNEAITSFGGATRILSSTTLTQNDTMSTYDIVTATDTAIAGQYYLYVVLSDGYDQNAYKAAGKLTVKHSPSITLDRPISGQPTVDTRDQKDLAISWTLAGDLDIDNDATIALLFDTTTANHTTAASLLGSASARNLTSGFTISENTDGTNDIYTFHVDSLSASTRPKAGGKYDFYALIKDAVDTTLSKAPGEVTFAHSPNVKWSLNFGGSTGGAKSSASADIGPLGNNQVQIAKGDVYGFDWDAYDLDQDQYLRLVVSLRDNVNSYADLIFPDEAGRTDSWLVNSTDGEQDANSVRTLDTNTDNFNWKTANMDSLSTLADNDIDASGTQDFYVYAFVTNDGSNPANWSGAGNVEVFPAGGKIRISELNKTSITVPNIQVQPSVISTAANGVTTFNVNLNTNGATATIVNVVLDVPNTVLRLVDQNTSAAGTQATIRTAGMFFGSATELLDTVVTNGTTDQIRIQLFLSGGGVATDSTVFQFQATSVGTLASTSVKTDVSYGTYTDLGGNTVTTSMYNGAAKLSITVPTTAIKVQTIPLARIEGHVPLQGRDTDQSHEVTFELRPVGSFLPITDTLFANTNDQNATKAGLQRTTASDGSFALSQVPSGTYNLVVKANNYLSAQYPDFTVVPGDLADAITPTQNEDADPIDYQWLRGGDVSSRSASGVMDNQVSNEDIIYLQTYYNQDVTTIGNEDIGDIDGDGFVGFGDLIVASENFSETGVPPIFLKDQAEDNKGTTFEIIGVPDLLTEGMEFDVQIWIHNVADLRGYDFTLRYDPEMVQLVESPDALLITEFLTSADGGARATSFQVNDRKGLVFVGALLGQATTASGSGDLVHLKFRAVKSFSDRPDIRMDDIKVANSVGAITAIGSVTEIPTTFALKQNYPNPFNPVTNIRFQIPEASKVEMKIFNILGQEIRTLVNEAMPAGFYTYKWDGTNNSGLKVASGVYIYQIKAGTFEASQKMLLLK